jgi:hypothetical protein
MAPLPPDTPVQKALHDVVDQVQRTMWEHEKRPPLDRSDILATIREKVHNIGLLVGRKNGTNAFRLQLVDLAAYVIYAIAQVGENKISSQ